MIDSISLTDLDNHDDFIQRHIGPDAQQQQENATNTQPQFTR